jgi:hypothetical protein
MGGKWGVTMLPSRRTTREAGGNASDGLGLGSFAQHLKIAQGSVRAGYFEDQGVHPDSKLTFAELATIHEMGFSISGTDISVPPRPFMRRSFAKNTEKYVSMAKDLVNDVLDQKTTVESGLENLGQVMESDLQQSIMDISWAEHYHEAHNKKSTIDKKGFDHVLLDSGALVEAVEHRVLIQKGAERFRVPRGPLPERSS